MKLGFLHLVLILFVMQTIKAQENKFELNAGLRFQKTQKLYWENGVTVDFASDKILDQKVHFSLNITSSRIGSAFNSNAIKQENYLFGIDWRFREKKSLQFFTGVGLGYFHSDLESEIFDILPNNSMLFSIEAGIFYKFKFPLASSFSYSYNLISGDGVNGPGTLFPVYFQWSLFYIFKK